MLEDDSRGDVFPYRPAITVTDIVRDHDGNIGIVIGTTHPMGAEDPEYPETLTVQWEPLLAAHCSDHHPEDLAVVRLLRRGRARSFTSPERKVILEALRAISLDLEKRSANMDEDAPTTLRLRHEAQTALVDSLAAEFAR